MGRYLAAIKKPKYSNNIEKQDLLNDLETVTNYFFGKKNY
jgi:hypothetical protein